MDFEKLILKLSDQARAVFEQAVAEASSWGHGSVEICHWLCAAMTQSERDVICLFEASGLSLLELQQQLTLLLERERRGFEGCPKISPEVMQWLFEAWMLASGEFHSPRVYPCHLMLALLDVPALALKYTDRLPVLGRMRADAAREQCLCQGREKVRTDSEPRSALTCYGQDLTALARQGALDPVLCREMEVRQMIDVLCRRRQNNVILTGEAGVGKTAVVEGLAQLIVAGRVPPVLENVRLVSLDLGALQAGASVKGEFEKRLRQVIQEIEQSAVPVILFIDEAHGLIGAGNAAGQGDAANLLKPALARGVLRTIAATTWAEYKKYFQTDAALSRRFQVVPVAAPAPEAAILILRNLAAGLERHHGVTVTDEAIVKAVQWSVRYIAGRELPDKCVSVLDTACARVALSQVEEPVAMSLARRAVLDSELEHSRLALESCGEAIHADRMAAIGQVLELAKEKLIALERAWRAQRALVVQVADLQRQMHASKHQASDQYDMAHVLKALEAELLRLQGDYPLVYRTVDARVIAEVIADWTGIPVGRMHSDDREQLLGLERQLAQTIKGQGAALEQIARLVRSSRAGLMAPETPAGVFMLVGPSGVGKTQTALMLAETLYGSEQSLTVINMSEFKEAHKVSLLLGAPPGYVGFGEGGVLTEAIRRRPYGVVLLDEMEKAHESCQEIFYQVFDKGMLKDGQGRDIDCRNTLFILTSNAASDLILRLCAVNGSRPEPQSLLDTIAPALRAAFKPALLGRMTVVPFYPLTETVLADIAKQQLAALAERITAHYGLSVVFSDAVKQKIVSQCVASDTGARDIAALLSRELMPELAAVLLGQAAIGTQKVALSIDVGQSRVDARSAVFSISLSPTGG